jgi:hypothetical protein
VEILESILGRTLVLATMLLANVGCEGFVSTPGAAGSSPQQEATPDRETVVGPPLGSAFAVERQQVRLLPFSVRMAKLSTVVGVPVDSPLFASLVEDRLALGDHDYAHGIPVGRSWSAHQMSVWVKDLLPVCDSGEMKARYPNLVTDQAAFVERAFGRRADPDDRALIDESLAEVPGLDDDAQYRAVCLALLSSAEMLSE